MAVAVSIDFTPDLQSLTLGITINLFADETSATPVASQTINLVAHDLVPDIALPQYPTEMDVIEAITTRVNDVVTVTQRLVTLYQRLQPYDGQKVTLDQLEGFRDEVRALDARERRGRDGRRRA